MKQTNSIDNIECPYCGTLFDGREACNGDMDCRCVTCPKCERDIAVSMSIEYFAEEMEQEDET